jgi:hypothetical protein
VEHKSVVAIGPSRAAGHLFAHKAVYGFDTIVRELLIIKQVAEMPVKTILFGITYAQQAVAEHKSIFIIYARFIAGEFGGPVGHIAAIKYLNPFFLVRVDRVGTTAHRKKEEAQKKAGNQKEPGGTGIGSHRVVAKGISVEVFCVLSP